LISVRRAYAIVSLAAVACGGSVASSDDTSLDGSTSTSNDATTSSLDGSTTGSDGGVVTVDAGPPVQPVACGDAGCDPSTQVCCVTVKGPQNIQQQCVANGSCQGSSFSCTGSANCPNGEVCCADFQGGGGGGSVTTTCKSQCAGGFQEPQLCQSAAECPPGDQCRQIFGGLKACVAPFDGGGPPPKDAGPG